MGKFKDFKQQQYETKMKRSHKLPAVLVTHGNHSLTAVEKAAKMGRENKTPEQKTVSEGRMADDVERTTAEHNEIHKTVAPSVSLDRKSEKDAVINYCDSSRDLNMALINHHNGHAWKDAMSSHLGDMDSVLDRAKTTSDMHVYSGINWSPVQHIQHKHEGDNHVEMHLPAFTSTSTSLKQACGFAPYQYPHPKDEEHGVAPNDVGGEHSVRHVLRIHVPKGAKAMSVMSHSFNPVEKEVLLHRGHELHIRSKPQRHVEKSGDIVNIWDAAIKGHYPANVHGEDL